MTEEPVTVLKIIKAEDAPLGVPLWPADYEALLPHHTLERVEVVQSVRSLVGDRGPFVRWMFVSGTTRAFRLGEEIVVEVPVEQDRGPAQPELRRNRNGKR
jgi:hypothetical protein